MVASVGPYTFVNSTCGRCSIHCRTTVAGNTSPPQIIRFRAGKSFFVISPLFAIVIITDGTESHCVIPLSRINLAVNWGSRLKRAGNKCNSAPLASAPKISHTDTSKCKGEWHEILSLELTLKYTLAQLIKLITFKCVIATPLG